MKVYTYKKCGTCKKATAWLNDNAIAFQEIAIRETPPAKAELKRMLTAHQGELRRLFNTSGGDYKEMKLKDKLPKMTEAQALDLLAQHGNLVKRPFVIGKGVALIGFKEDQWRAALL